jgi:hypothetical protein
LVALGVLLVMTDKSRRSQLGYTSLHVDASQEGVLLILRLVDRVSRKKAKTEIDISTDIACMEWSPTFLDNQAGALSSPNQQTSPKEG